MSNVLEILKELLSEKSSGALDIEITKDTVLSSELGLDSLRLADIMVSIEERFDLIFDETDLDPDAINKVEDLVELIKTTKEKEID